LVRVQAELHCHTTFSDGERTIQDCIKAALSKGLSVIAITDHNVNLDLEVAKKLSSKRLLVIPGEEVSTDKGHVLAYFVKNKIEPGLFEDVVLEVRRQGALCFMAHPCQKSLLARWRGIERKELGPEETAVLDGIEVENGRNLPVWNREARGLAKQRGLKGISGSDAHSLVEIGNARTILTLGELTEAAAKAALVEGRFAALSARFCAYPLRLLTAIRAYVANGSA